MQIHKRDNKGKKCILLRPIKKIRQGINHKGFLKNIAKSFRQHNYK